MQSVIDIVLNTITNLSAYISLFIIYIALQFYKKPNLIKKIIAGLLLGGFLILVLLNPWKINDQFIFDARTVFLSVSGYFFGLIPTVIATIFGIAFRIYIGGAGVIPGSLTLVLSAGMGILWPKLSQYFKNFHEHAQIYIFGLLVHIGTLIIFLFIPNEGFEIVKITILPYLVFFPVLTVFLFTIINNYKLKEEHNSIIFTQRQLLQETINASRNIEIFSLDREYRYLVTNEFHQKQMKFYYDVDIKKGMNYLDCIDIERLKKRFRKNIDLALTGDGKQMVLEQEVYEGKFLEEIYYPFRNQKNEVVGVTISLEDVSECVSYQKSIISLSYKDALTNIYNRRYFSEQLLKYNREYRIPITIIFIDINGLKIMNDAFGHDAGDALLVIVSNQINEIFSSYGDVMRIGGDEFAAILPNITEKQAQKLINDATDKFKYLYVNNMRISVAFGVATKEGDEDIMETIKQAEDDMYSKKVFSRNSHRNEVVQTIINTLHEKNPEEEAHSRRVSLLCQMIGKKIDMGSQELELLEMISKLHDIGKIAISNEILNKPGKLTLEEWEEIKRHPEIGYRILVTSPTYSYIAEDILSHHERWDGSGYPRGLKGEEIPLRARIISLADAYDAMISERPYRKKKTKEEAIEEIKINKGTQFDPKLADIFIDILTNEIN